MFEFHQDKKEYFDINFKITTNAIIPLIEKIFPIENGMRVLEVGCGEAGVLKAFAAKQCICVGVDNDASRIQQGRELLKDTPEARSIVLIPKDIFSITHEEFNGRFDLIVLKDVIEHIHDKEQLLLFLKSLLNPGGKIFFGFPPWQMPFGGHQQICRSKLLSRLPYFHLLPKQLYKYILKKAGEPVADLMEIRDTRLSIEDFEKVIAKCGFNVVYKELYLTNPIYQYKFNLRTIRQNGLVKRIPYIRNFVTTCAYYIVSAQ